ncbi:ProQ/FinO family protein [Cupriavidus oxalaticus]|uniref:ProQ activator of osmoprotectant transporter ProP n=1 Tax=Cupriavidus oxalaticus TaxID=96344 RepID=A0A375FY67_9BURK|nr:ProQ/FinO family protein [Cupriavidus oxalaticus]QRQ95662.1 ProQ/FinO family protein [Cupriavidus oxalaticus]SPC10499.1 ProQ activator of osmoprotectant transporter ProP [Cupriavidus oxalaticus]SPC12220.1 ProQ activator of osmoprotectant transporter ProP [Cupriavidus oxalaticus]
MGFEQLAALKAKLVEQAKAEKAAESAKRTKGTNGNKGTTDGKGTNGGKGAKGPKGNKPARARDAAPAVPEKPVDPVVLAISRLQKRFPAVFPKNPAPKVPLKVGIFQDLVQHAQELKLTEAELRDAIRTWCRGARYWNGMVEGAARVDLAGEPAGQVTEADARRARQLQRSRTARPLPKQPAQQAEQARQAQQAQQTQPEQPAQATEPSQADKPA